MIDEPEPVLSPADIAAVESLYRKITTPWRCRLGLHRWDPWQYVMSFHFGAIEVGTGRQSKPGQLDLSLRICPKCTKVQAKAVPAEDPEQIDTTGIEGCGDE